MKINVKENDNEDNKMLSNNIYNSTNEKTRDARDLRDYDKLEIKINKIQNDIEYIKKIQENIIDLLRSKL